MQIKGPYFDANFHTLACGCSTDLGGFVFIVETMQKFQLAWSTQTLVQQCTMPGKAGLEDFC